MEGREGRKWAGEEVNGREGREKMHWERITSDR